MRITDSNGKYSFRIGITLKLYLIINITFLGLLAATVYIIHLNAQKQTDTIIKNKLNLVTKQIEYVLDVQWKYLRSAAQKISTGSSMFPLVYAKDRVSLDDLSDELRRRTSLDIIIFTDERGVVLSRIDKPSEVGLQIGSKSSLVVSALNGKIGSGYMRKDSQLLQIIAVPVVDNIIKNIVRGSIIIAKDTSVEVSKNLNNLAGCEVVHLAMSKKWKRDPSSKLIVPYSTLDKYLLDSSQSQNLNIWRDVSKIYTESELTLELNKNIYQGIVYPLVKFEGEPVGALLALLSRTELLLPFKKLNMRVIQTGLIFFILGSLIFFYISKKFNYHILEVVRRMESVRRGNLSLKPPPVIKDEIDYINQALYDMSLELKDKLDLENHLAVISQSVKPTESLKMVESVLDEYIPGSTDTLIFPPGFEFTDRYIIKSYIGEGASAFIYLAFDKFLKEKVAIKVFSKLDLDKSDLELFKKEIVLSRKITHQNVIRIYEFGEYEEINYMTMEYVRGSDLSVLLKTFRKMDLKNALILGRQICYGISQVHSEGIVHCDLKPRNILISLNGIIKISDFGISRLIRNPDSDGSSREGRNETHFFGGTPRYMAPEQFEKNGVDLRADIYAIGIVLYELITGKTPFVAQTVREFARKHKRVDAPTIKKGGLEVPDALEEIIAKCLKKKPGDRFNSALELGHALSKVDVRG